MLYTEYYLNGEYYHNGLWFFLFKTLWNIIHYILRVLYNYNIYNNIIDLADFAVAKI